MKKMYLLAAMALMMIGCSSNDEDKLPADELLAGTEWRYGTFYDDYDDNLDVPPQISIEEDHFAFLDAYFPDVQLICTIGEVSTTDEEETTQGEEPSIGPRAKLTFTNRECLYYSDEGISYTTVKVIRHYSQTTTYVAQSYTSSVNPNITLEVTKDAIIWYRLIPTEFGLYKDAHTCLVLDNFQHTKTWNETISSDTEESCINPMEETFQYQRTGNEVVLTNSNKKWIGTLDTDKWTLSLVQIVPEKKEMPTFSLK
jgi:hypothetical protein